MLLSIGLHALAAMLLVFLVPLLLRECVGASGLELGERGREGAGGPVVDIGIEHPLVPGAPLAEATPVVPDPPEPAPSVERAPVVRAPERPLTVRESEVQVEATDDQATPADSPAEEPVAEEEPATTRPSPPPRESNERPTSGTGAAVTSGGRAPGDPGALIRDSAGLGNTTGAREALLRGGAFCSDPIAGTWVATKYRPDGRDWVRFTLHVRREAGDILSGRIVSRTWNGSPSSMRPPPCTPFGMDMTVEMPARGYLAGDRVTFGASTHRIVREDCPRRPFRYYPDRFSGTVDPDREQLEVLNNDGYADIDVPYTFRRVSCD